MLLLGFDPYRLQETVLTNAAKDVGEIELLAKKPKEMHFRIILQPEDQSDAWKPELQKAVA